MNGRKQVALLFLGSEAFSAALAESSVGLVLVALSLVALFVGYVKRSGRTTVGAGLCLYYPLSLALSRIVSGAWSYLASATVLIVITEGLAFQYQLSSVLDSPRGVDEESRLLASALSKSHTSSLVWFTLLSSVVSSFSLVASKAPQFAPLIAAAAIALMVVTRLYARR